MQKRKTYFIGILILLIAFSFGIHKFQTQAGTGETGAGWLWGGSDDGGVPANSTGLGWISMNNISGGGVNSYGANIPSTDGLLSGYAWSENVGWINFNGASRSGNNIIGSATIQGIADEALIGNAGGWQGKISLSGTAQDSSPYGVSINTAVTPNTLSGFGWSDELGWIDFSRSSISACVPAASYSYACFNGSSCGACGSAATTNPWICTKTDSCGNSSWASQAECTANGVASCADAVCPACKRDLNWREVNPN